MIGLKVPCGALFCLVLFLLCAFPTSGFARDSASLSGTLGLNLIPNARMDDVGMMRVNYSRFAKSAHASLGVQISDRLYLGFRQTVDKQDDPHLFPGMDLKFKLFEERAYRPEISVGLQSALGHKRMAAEYLALSKRYRDFDFTLGLGWGRMGTRQTIPNPLLVKSFSSAKRKLDGENPNQPSDWFTGDAGLFGGIQYDIPTIDGLSIKADWSSDNWQAEQSASSSFNAPAPWSIGLSYRPYDWIDAGIAMAGLDHFMARISLSPNLQGWEARSSSPEPPIALLDGRPTLPALYQSGYAETSEQIGLSRIGFNDIRAEAVLDLKDTTPSAFQIGQGARHLSNMAGQRPEQIAFQLARYGLRGPSLILNRRDIEQAGLTHQGSAEEIWRNTLIEDIVPKSIQIAREKFKESFGFRIDWISDLSLAEDENNILYRTALIPSLTKRIGKHFITENAMRFNLADNFDHMSDYKGVSLTPIRSDIEAFTKQSLIIERQYLAGFVSLAKDLHAAASLGYLEEMYAGLTGEILYRPFGKSWAIGVEVHEAVKRDPTASLALAPNGDPVLSGFLNGYYEFTGTGATLQASVGRYLAGDVGGSLALNNEFDNGVRVGGFVVATNKSDFDVYGGETNLYAGMNLSMPLGSLPFIPDDSRLILNTKPLGRDTAQRLENPVALYDVTEPLSYRSLTRHWSALTP
ncbi:MAG: YjbH domain-containing protein [Alphaproteobacteria bacterium]|nr:YjbH domain-containing protein [Alphaproteobacteria bacterium]MCB9984345.1 YjbH domain-containing protein [Micavibrio sp.]